MELRNVAIEEIIPYANNPRQNDKAVDKVAESIKQCGYIAPIIVDEDMVVLAGHTILRALKKLKNKTVQIAVVAGLSEEQKKYRLLDNKTNEFADWDMEKLLEELEGLDFEGVDFGFDLGDMNGEEAEAQEDDYDQEPPEEPKSKLGQVYKLGRHRLMCGDSTSKDDVKKLVGGTQVDLLLTDPPYNVDYTGKTADALKIENDKMEDGNFRQFLIDAFAAADAVMKPGACFYIWHADSEGYNFRGACKDVGWPVRQCIIWNKNTMVMGRQDYQWKHEPCLYGWKEGAGHLWASDRKQTTVINFNKPTRNDIHPTMKPVGLFDYQIKNNTKGGDAVLDLFAGSGTTIMACEQNGRNAYCMEFDPRYVDAIIDRWETFTGQKAELVEE
ncbi:MAG: DNA modification methylase [Fibrobacter sp.]|nr:DNA modification methylase [Fibrobacter sp.]